MSAMWYTKESNGMTVMNANTEQILQIRAYILLIATIQVNCSK